MAVDAVLALEAHHDHRRGRRGDRVGDRRFEPGTIADRAVDEPVQPRDLRKVEPERRGEDLLDTARGPRRGKKVEDTPAVVAATTDRGLKPWRWRPPQP